MHLASHVLVKALEAPEGLAALTAVAELNEVELVVPAVGKRLPVIAEHPEQYL